MKTINLSEEQFKRFGNVISFDNPLSIDMHLLREGKLREGLIKTYPSDKVITYISKYLGINEDLIEISKKNGVDTFIITLPKDDALEAETIKVMTNLCGYFLSFKRTRDDNKEIKLFFEPKFQDEVTKMVNNEKFLIHASPYFNRDKIIKYGFIPKTKNTLFKYPDRVYFFLGSNGIDNTINIVRQIDLFKDNVYIDKTYDFYLIDVSKIPENIKFQIDPNAKNCVFTTDSIPSKTIMKIRRIKI